MTTNFQTQQNLAAQRSKAMIFGHRPELDTEKQSLPQPTPAATVNFTRLDYQTQLMRLEQQNRRRLLTARHISIAREIALSQSSRPYFTGFYEPHRHLVSPCYQTNWALLVVQNRELLLLAMQPSVNLGLIPPASQPTSQATMVQSHASQGSGREPPRTQPQQTLFDTSQATTSRQPESMPGPSYSPGII